jgi:hypothetical protein
VKDDGAGIGRQYFADLIVGQVFNIEFTRARGEKTAGKASVATKPFQGIRIDVKHCGPIRRGLGTTAATDGQQKPARGRGTREAGNRPRRKKVEERFVGKSGFMVGGCRDSGSTGAPYAGFSAIR